MTRAAIGLRAHSGWAALVAVTGVATDARALMRRRIELADSKVARPFQPYHAAAKMELIKAEKFIARVTRSARLHAQQGIEGVMDELGKQGFRVTECVVLVGSGRPLGTLESTLAAHPLIHTAEGVLFRKALIGGAADCGLRVLEAPERALIVRACAALRLTAEELRAFSAELGQPLGRPWAQDEKYSALAACLALAAK